MTHPYDPGSYHLLLFSATGRRRPRKMLVRNFIRAQRACHRWVRRTGGSAVIMKCLFNTQLARPAYPEKMQ